MKNVLPSRYLKLVAIAVFALAGPAFAQNAVYRWTGDDGVIHYGATPPVDVEAELVKAGNSGSGVDDEGAGTDSDSSGTSEGEDAEQPQVKLSPEMQARKDKLCKEERQRLETLKRPGRLRMQQPDGSTKYLSIEEVQVEINTSEQVIKDTCG